MDRRQFLTTSVEAAAGLTVLGQLNQLKAENPQALAAMLEPKSTTPRRADMFSAPAGVPDPNIGVQHYGGPDLNLHAQAAQEAFDPTHYGESITEKFRRDYFDKAYKYTQELAAWHGLAIPTAVVDEDLQLLAFEAVYNDVPWEKIQLKAKNLQQLGSRDRLLAMHADITHNRMHHKVLGSAYPWCNVRRTLMLPGSFHVYSLRTVFQDLATLGFNLEYKDRLYTATCPHTGKRGECLVLDQAYAGPFTGDYMKSAAHAVSINVKMSIIYSMLTHLAKASGVAVYNYNDPNYGRAYMNVGAVEKADFK